MSGAAPTPGAAERAAAWIYTGLWSVLVSWFRVPRRPPTLPVAPGGFRDAFQPAPGFLRYLRFWFWVVALLIDLAIIIGWIAVTIALWWLGLLLLPLAIFLAVVPDIVAYIALHLRYDTTWYVMTERSLRIRRGAWIIREVTITFENVQNVKVKQGPVERAFGIASIMVETAGAGGESGRSGTSVSNCGILEGLADAPRIRDLILARVRPSVSAGLGDEPEAGTAPPRWTGEHLAVLREIRDELLAPS